LGKHCPGFVSAVHQSMVGLEALGQIRIIKHRSHLRLQRTHARENHRTSARALAKMPPPSPRRDFPAFPFAPYQIQSEFMSFLYAALSSGPRALALLESPTGKLSSLPLPLPLKSLTIPPPTRRRRHRKDPQHHLQRAPVAPGPPRRRRGGPPRPGRWLHSRGHRRRRR
jgi:chromosome transmission fidelity protein 1